MFSKILIANRGEIVLRVIRTAREMGIRTVAVYSEIDRDSPHVLEADEAVCLGPAPSSQSYLRADRILEEAKRLGAEAIHPGYGFLSENADFARACEQQGLAFIGPTAEVIETMGSKTRARQTMIAAGVPVVPGTESALADPQEAVEVARKIGLPVMIKAAAGGGGKGMRLVEREEELVKAVEAATREAKASFGNGDVYIEKFVARPHHIEVQILADTHGTVLHLGERECSVQRRHQKVVEESPSPFVDEKTRAALCETAVQAARAVGYRNAGTIEFLMDKDRNFYFLEMNTRLQVEHAVTEMVTGIDLVEQQLRVAAGEKLQLSQERIEFRGHAIECRVCAEDCLAGFVPATGRVTAYQPPEGPGVRMDSGLRPGLSIGMHYDPMMAKLICWHGTREGAIARSRRALREFRLRGVTHNLDFCDWVLALPEFVQGDYSTKLLGEHPYSLDHADGEQARAAALWRILHEAEGEVATPPGNGSGKGKGEHSPWYWKHRSL